MNNVKCSADRSISGFTLIEMSIVLLIIGILMSIAVPSYLRVKDNSCEKACCAQLRMIQDAKDRWAIDNKKSSSDTPTMNDLVPAYLRKIPECPRAGSYHIGTVAEPPTCSIDGHEME